MKKICVVLFLICFPFVAYPSSLNSAYKDYLYGNYEQAVETARRLRSDDEVLYFLGLVYMKTRDFSKARISLDRLIEEFPQSRVYESGVVKMADTYFLGGYLSKAKSLYKEIEANGRCSNFMPLVYLRLAQIYSKEGAWDNKNKYLRLLRARYSNSSEMKFVKILEAAGDFFFIQVGAFSDKDNAEGLKGELKNDYPVYIDEEIKSGYTLYKVRIGDFQERNKVEAISSALMQKGYPARIYP
ncbi:MAG: SPOR domain-containing protein [Candidatus Omnitrophica bacterium]|nr:SPOR domain-containing protein [Candidatus Omnitrophota bacterium]